MIRGKRSMDNMVSLGYIKDKGYLTVKDAARLLGVDRKTLYRWEVAKKIPAARRHPMNKYRVYTQEDIDKIKKLLRIKP